MDTPSITKQLLWSFYQRGNAEPQRIPELAAALLHTETRWHGFAPLGHLRGAKEVIARFWKPLISAIPDLQRRPYILIAGSFEGRDWVASTGDFIGSFVKDWLGIPASGSSVHFRYGAFYRLEGDRVVETRLLVDLLELARQAGFELWQGPGLTQWVPGPLQGDGVLLGSQRPSESKRTLELVEAMIFKGLNSYDQQDQASQRLERYWHPHMVWHGPVGIGSAYGLADFKRHAQGPIVHAFPDRKGAGHKARLAEGRFAASTGWPSLVGTHQRDFLGWAPTGEKVGWNIMDFWRREADKLLENWVLIDLVDAGLQSGIDLLAQLALKDANSQKRRAPKRPPS